MSHIQGVSGAPGGGTSVTTATFPAIGVGNSIVGAVNSGISNTNLTSVTDNAGNSYTVGSVVLFSPYNVWYYLFWGLNLVGSPTTLTFHYTTSETLISFAFDEYSNISGVNTSAISYTGATTINNPNQAITTTVPGCTIWGFVNDDASASATPGSGFSLRINDATNSFFTEDQVQTAAGAINVNWTFSSNATYVVAAVALTPSVTPDSHQSYVNPNLLKLGNDLRTWTHAVQQQLIGKDIFFSVAGLAPTYDYPNPKGYIPDIVLKTHINPMQQQLIGQDNLMPQICM